MNDIELFNSSQQINSLYKSHSNINKKPSIKSNKKVVINNQNIKINSFENKRHSYKNYYTYIKISNTDENQLILNNGNNKKNYVKSFTLDTLKKKYKNFEGLLGKENNIRKKRTFVKRNQILSRNEPKLYIDSGGGGGGTLNYWKTTFQTNNDTYNSTYRNSTNNHLSLFNKSKNNEKNLLLLASNNYNKNKIMMNQKLSHYKNNNNKILLNTKESDINSQNKYNFIVDFPKKNNKDTLNLKTEKNIKFNKNFLSNEKSTTINIYNNKINNINNIILNESDINNGANSEKNFKINIERTLPNELPSFYKNKQHFFSNKQRRKWLFRV